MHLHALTTAKETSTKSELQSFAESCKTVSTSWRIIAFQAMRSHRHLHITILGEPCGVPEAHRWLNAKFLASRHGSYPPLFAKVSTKLYSVYTRKTWEDSIVPSMLWSLLWLGDLLDKILEDVEALHNTQRCIAIMRPRLEHMQRAWSILSVSYRFHPAQAHDPSHLLKCLTRNSSWANTRWWNCPNRVRSTSNEIKWT